MHFQPSPRASAPVAVRATVVHRPNCVARDLELSASCETLLSTMSSAAVLGVTGIIVSGVVGPLVAAWASRRGDRERFSRDQLQRRREDLRAVVDEGAVLLGVGETNLRVAHEAVSRGEPEPAEVREWAGKVHLLGQRLLLRLPSGDPIVTAYERVRQALVAVGEAYGDQARYGGAVSAFEERRTEFLGEARTALERT